MNLQSKIIVSLFIFTLIGWVIRLFFKKKLTSGQTLLWLTLLTGTEVLTIFVSLVDGITVLWGNLLPVSWITFVGMVFVIGYLLSQSVYINNLQTRQEQLVRSLAFLEKEFRDVKPKRVADDLSNI